jgi:DnaJ-class molecular chaperone
MTRGYGHFFGFLGDWVRFARRDDLAYRTLGVSEAAEDAEIEQAYVRLMAQYQPERLAGLAGSIRRRTQRKAVEIDTAYARIRTMRRRAVSAQSAVARSDDRAMPAALVWLALALNRHLAGHAGFSGGRHAARAGHCATGDGS